MSEKNFASYGDMETLVTEIASKCGPYTKITYEDWLKLTPYQQEHGRWDVTGVPTNEGYTEADKCMLSDGVTSVEEAVDEVNSSKMNYNTPHYTGVLSNDAYDTTSTDQYAKQVLNVYDGQNLIIGNRISCNSIFFQTKSTDIPLSSIVKIIYDQVEPINVKTGQTTSYNFYSRANSMKPQGMKLLGGIYAGAYPMQTWNAQCILNRVNNAVEQSKIEVCVQSIGQAQNYSIGMYYIYIPA